MRTVMRAHLVRRQLAEIAFQLPWPARRSEEVSYSVPLEAYRGDLNFIPTYLHRMTYHIFVVGPNLGGARRSEHRGRKLNFRYFSKHCYHMTISIWHQYKYCAVFCLWRVAVFNICLDVCISDFAVGGRVEINWTFQIYLDITLYTFLCVKKTLTSSVELAAMSIKDGIETGNCYASCAAGCVCLAKWIHVEMEI